jgi:hypothetical protein
MISSARGDWCLAVTVCMLAGLSGCAAPADPARMVSGPSPDGGAFPSALSHAMCVRTVTGGEQTNPLWTSEVSSDDFHHALAAPNACKYPVDANLLGLSKPTFGFSMEVTSHVNYKVYDAAGQPILLETISAAYTEPAGFNSGVKRLQLAEEGSIRASFAQFLNKVRAVRLP